MHSIPAVRHTPAVRRGTAIVLALGLGLAACTPTGPAAPATSTAAASATGGGAGSAECANVQATLQAVGQRLEGLQAKLPGDVPGAISDVQTSVTDLTTLSAGVSDGELKGHLDDLAARGTELVGILEQAQSGSLSPLEATSQGAAKLREVQTTLDAIDTYCAGA